MADDVAASAVSSRGQLTEAQRELLSRVPERVSIEALDRLWIFPARAGKSRETGLLVLSHTGETGDAEQRRVVVTIRYVAESTPRGLRVEDVVTQEGWAFPEQIERVIAGVLARAGDVVGDPLEEEVGGHQERWAELLARHTARVDLPNGE